MVLCLASLRPSAGEQGRARVLAPAVDWDRFLRLSLESGLAGLIGRSLGALGEEIAPAETRESLAQAARRCRRRNAVLYNFLGETLAALTEFGVPHLVLKGAALVDTVYGDAGLREMADADILLPRGRRREAIAYLAQRGLDREGRGIDTQWLLTDRGIRWTQIAVDRIWSTARPATIAGQETLVMSPEYQLLHLCLHGDAFVSLKWLCDVRELLHAHPELDWRAFCELALTDGVVRRHVYRKLCLAEEVLNAPVPAEVLRHVDPAGLRGALIRRLTRRWSLGGERVGQARLNRAPEVFLLETVAMGDLSQLRHAVRLVFRPDPRWARARYREAGERPAHSASMARAAARAVVRAAGAFLRR
jgi:hypothetical protein